MDIRAGLLGTCQSATWAGGQAYREVGYSVVRLLFLHRGGQHIAVVLKRGGAQKAAYVVGQVVGEKLQHKDSVAPMLEVLADTHMR